MRPSVACSALLSPTTSFESFFVSRFSECVPETACWIALSKSSASNGFVKNSIAPALIAFTDIGMLPWPVRKMIGTLSPALASSLWSSSPLRPGSSTSRITQDSGA